MRTLRGKLIASMTAAVCAIVGLAASAAATPSAPAGVPTIQYTKAEKQALQAKVDAYLAKSVGGKQVGINQIAWEDGMVLTLPLPGETKARAVDEPITPKASPNCPSTFACLYSGTWYEGARVAEDDCITVTLSDRNFANVASSIHNNQTNNTRTTIYNSSGQILNESQALSKINDVGVGAADRAVRWRVC